MLPHAYAAELQYRYDAAVRDRELRLLASIREHEAARARARHTAPAPAPAPVAARPRVLATEPAARAACPV